MRHRSRLGALVAVAVAVALCCGCGTSTPVALATPTPSSLPTPSPAVGQPVRVAVIVMENRSYAEALALPYIHSVATTATVLSDYQAASHPSLPNYLMLTSGSTWGITDDGYHVLPKAGIGEQLINAGIPWRAYMEGVGSDCRQNLGRYAVKHDPFAYYGGRCPAAVVPLTDLAGDLAGESPPRYMFISPDLCHDMHDCSSDVGDAWLARTVPTLLGSLAMSNAVLFITWDENEHAGSNQVLTIVLGARRPVDPGAAYSHSSLLAAAQDLLGLPRLPATAAVTAIALH